MFERVCISEFDSQEIKGKLYGVNTSPVINQGIEYKKLKTHTAVVW